MSALDSKPAGSGGQGPKLLDRLRARLQERGFGLDRQNRHVEWCRQFILFHGKRHPAEMGQAEVEGFLQDLGARRLPLSWRREACEAVGFLYREEIGREVPLPDLRRDIFEVQVLSEEEGPRLVSAIGRLGTPAERWPPPGEAPMWPRRLIPLG